MDECNLSFCVVCGIYTAELSRGSLARIRRNGDSVWQVARRMSLNAAKGSRVSAARQLGIVATKVGEQSAENTET